MILGAEYVTTGASNDIERATGLARSMVTKWGLSERLGPLMYDETDGEPKREGWCPSQRGGVAMLATAWWWWPWNRHQSAKSRKRYYPHPDRGPNH